MKSRQYIAESAKTAAYDIQRKASMKVFSQTTNLTKLGYTSTAVAINMQNGYYSGEHVAMAQGCIKYTYFFLVSAANTLLCVHARQAYMMIECKRLNLILYLKEYGSRRSSHCWKSSDKWI